MAREIQVVPHDPAWRVQYEAEADSLRAVFGDLIVGIWHIGSTAIPGICAKPTIDILVAVRDINGVDRFDNIMSAHGYMPRGEYGIPGRRYFVKGTPELHTHHAHMFQEGNLEIARHLAFCDYMIAHPAEAQAYSQLKEGLARRFRDDPEGYTNGKDAFVKEMDRRAAAWRQATSPPPDTRGSA